MGASVVSVNSKDTPGVGKLPQPEVTLLAGHGVEGDYHAGAFVRHRSRAAKSPQEPNLRQVHLIHSELFDELAGEGIHVSPGQMGENVTTRGLALLDVSAGTRLRLGESAVLEVTGLRNPCNQLDAVDKRLLARVAERGADGSIVRRAGIMAIVLEGGVVRPGDAIVVEAPAGAPRTLEPI